MVERIGIERTWGEVAKADVIMHLLDAAHGPSKADDHIIEAFPQGIPVIRIWNKIDLSGHKPSVTEAPDATHVYLSAHEHIGIDLLRAELLRIAGWQQTGESLFLARERHLIALRSARKHLQMAEAHAAQTDQSLDLFAEELRAGAGAVVEYYRRVLVGRFAGGDLQPLLYRQVAHGMARFMLDREILCPPDFSARSCILVKYRLPLLSHCYVLCHDSQTMLGMTPRAELIAFFIQQAEVLALEAVGDDQAYVAIHSGSTIRKRSNLHMHVFVVQHRWQKAWVYLIQGAKNLSLAVSNAVSMAASRVLGKGLAPKVTVFSCHLSRSTDPDILIKSTT
ncbi:hypothetical protein LP420_22600 [Massilia sp. B-10]|nr:hypothetical protein LP420_22600 [Massilia sp. B-10]